MLMLARLEHGWGLQATFQQLSVWNWNGKAKTIKADLPNLWEGEIERLVKEKKLGRTTLAHQDNYDAIGHLYLGSGGELPLNGDRWMRRSKTMLNQLHVLAEQAAVQWALAHMEEDPHCATMAAGLMRIFQQVETHQELLELHDIMIQAANQAELESGTFSKILMEKLEQQDRSSDDSSPPKPLAATSGKKTKQEESRTNDQARKRRRVK